MNPVVNALKFRFACKQFNPDKKISPDQLDSILEAARLSPTSFGMEAWKFLVIQSQEIKEKLRPACWDQAQVTECSHLVVILADPSVVAPEHPYVGENFGRRQLPPDATKAYIERYKWYMETEVYPLMTPYAWCSKQCYIALANMMTAAAAAGIDSCPMEGFEKQKVERILCLEPQPYEVVVLLALGVRRGEQTPRRRRSKEQLIEYI